MSHNEHHQHHHQEERDESIVNSALMTLWWETYELWDKVLYRVGDVYDRVVKPSTDDGQHEALHDRRHKDDRRHPV